MKIFIPVWWAGIKKIRYLDVVVYKKNVEGNFKQKSNMKPKYLVNIFKKKCFFFQRVVINVF